jgi:hypothetical protein
MRYIYILLLCLIIYYIISRFYEKYTENFDPSLVPVSSIVTLAKVAQKLVDGDGTLTNPGNLTLGTPSGVGNLIVTGTSNLKGNTNVGGTLNVTGNTTLTGSTNVQGVLSVNDNKFTVDAFGNVDIKGNLNIVPRGCIMMWLQPTAPEGWEFCDGKDGRPDMKQRLILGNNFDIASQYGRTGMNKLRTGNGFAAIFPGGNAVDSDVFVVNFIIKS